MPAEIDSGDRKLLLIAAAILFVLTAGFAFVGIGPEGQGMSVPSTYSAGSGGARAAYLLLQELHYKVSRWERSPTELPIDEGEAVLILADPLESPTKEERQALKDFVEEGGQVLFTGGRSTAFCQDAKRGREFSRREWNT